jgi:hypothetical protein
VGGCSADEGVAGLGDGVGNRTPVDSALGEDGEGAGCGVGGHFGAAVDLADLLGDRMNDVPDAARSLRRG